MRHGGGMRTIILAAALCTASAVGYAQDWRPITRTCEAYAEKQNAPCADCATWQWLAECTAQNWFGASAIPAARQCIAEVAAARGPHAPAALGDPVKDTMDCLGAR